MQPYPRSPDLVWPGHLHGTGCLSARAVGTGFPTVVRRLCLGPGCGWVWVLLTPPVLAGVLGGCVWARFVVLSLFCRLFVVFVVGLRFWPAYGTCVVSCAPRLPPAVSGSGVRCGRACWARARLCPTLLGWVVGVCFLGFFFWLCGVGCWVSLSRALRSLFPHPLSFGLGCWLFFFFVVCVCMFRCPFSRWAAVPGLVSPVLAGWSPSPLCFSFLFGGGACLFLPLPSLGWRTHWPAFSVVFRAAVGVCVLFGCVLAPWVRWAMYTFRLAPVPAGLGPYSAGWAAAPGGCVWLFVRGPGLFVSFLLCGAGFNLLGCPPPLLPGARWPRVWPAVPVCCLLVRRSPGFAVACFG